ncbi:MAG TPA: M14 family zinc carboxypeptidase [Capsulimonadaceae bacterium]|nr:M14 family zinc carboxypeptidase [Capsulimonadaceae bacterium]
MRKTVGLIFAALVVVVVSARANAATSYSQMVARLNQDCGESPYIRVAALGKSASGERTVWIVRLADPAMPKPPARKVLILCRQHGDEPVSTEAALDVLDDIASGKNSDLTDELRHVTVYIVPMVNPDGADAGTRDSSDGANLNRDWGLFREPETRAVYEAFRQIHPQVVLDMHSWDEGDPFRGYCLEAPRPGAPGDPLLAQASRDLQQRGVLNLMEQTGQQVAVTNYGMSADRSLCHRFFLEDAGVVSLLFETQPDDAGQSFEKRITVAQAAITWLIGDVAGQPAWKGIAHREAQVLTMPQNVGAGAPAKLVFLSSAKEEGQRSPFGTAERIVRNVAKRVPAPVWWALGAYVLLCAARPIFSPKTGLVAPEKLPSRRMRKRRRGRGTEPRGRISA